MDSENQSLYTLVKPSFTDIQIQSLCRKVYGIEATDTIQLAGYDDQNTWIKRASLIGTNNYVDEIWQDGYVLKITNSKESENVMLIQAQIQILLHLAEHDITAPIPIKNVFGDYYSLEKVKGADGVCYCHVLRLLTFRSGKLLKQIQVNQSLSRELGEFLFELDSCLKPVFHLALTDRDLLFMLDKVPKLKLFLHVVKDERKRQLLIRCIQQFEEEVMTHLDDLEKGTIHGDFNEQNIIINDNKVSAILDFGDCHYGPYLFELAIGLAYMLLLTKDIEISKQFIKGYTKTKQLTSLEKTILPICVRARLCQSLVLGLYTYSLNPENEYLLSSQKDGWEALELLFQRDHLLAASRCSSQLLALLGS